ncbi:hypothetical protein F4825DRAFT_220198 [Nemania diffusa]|nr:hypothetical protein F4825DRAFT_220198 [Nemania diffusa]
MTRLAGVVTFLYSCMMRGMTREEVVVKFRMLSDAMRCNAIISEVSPGSLGVPEGSGVVRRTSRLNNKRGNLKIADSERTRRCKF